MSDDKIPEWLKNKIKRTKPLPLGISPIQAYNIAVFELFKILTKPSNLARIPEVAALIEVLNFVACNQDYKPKNINICKTAAIKALKHFNSEADGV